MNLIDLVVLGYSRGNFVFVQNKMAKKEQEGKKNGIIRPSLTHQDKDLDLHKTEKQVKLLL